MTIQLFLNSYLHSCADICLEMSRNVFLVALMYEDANQIAEEVSNLFSRYLLATLETSKHCYTVILITMLNNELF